MYAYAKLLILFLALVSTGVLWGLVVTAPPWGERAVFAVVVVGAILSTQITLGTALLAMRGFQRTEQTRPGG